MNEISVINNLSSNHYQHILDISKNADTLYIISPFLMESFDTIFSELRDMNISHIHLVTTLKNNNMDLLKKANSLHSFCSLCTQSNIKFNIYVDNKLHGKIYATSKDGVFADGILTSANFTDSGLNRNHEWGILIDNADMLEMLVDEVFSVCSKPISNTSISGIIEKVDDYFKTKQEPNVPKLDLTVDEFIDFGTEITETDRPSDIRYFIKPRGSADSPYSIHSKIDSDIVTLEFAKRKPRAVRIGDILICYAVGVTNLLGYFEVLTEPALTGDEDDRWPWTVQAKNLCPAYSDNWYSHNNTLPGARDKFTADEPITYNGGKTLGALNYGSDKIRLSERFARHLIQTIEDCAKGSVRRYDMGSLDSLVIEIASVLAQCCIDSETPIITYGDLARKLTIPVTPRNLDQPLGRLSDFCKENGLPLLSVIVVNQDTYFPGHGFFKYFFPQAKTIEWEKIYIEQLNLVASYKQWDELADCAKSYLCTNRL